MVYLFSAFLLTGASCNALYHVFTVLLEIKLTLQQADDALITGTLSTGTYQQLQEAVWVQGFFCQTCSMSLGSPAQKTKVKI